VHADDSPEYVAGQCRLKMLQTLYLRGTPSPPASPLPLAMVADVSGRHASLLCSMNFVVAYLATAGAAVGAAVTGGSPNPWELKQLASGYT
jgi:hypothetical protein